jgi:hypothetical protein
MDGTYDYKSLIARNDSLGFAGKVKFFQYSITFCKWDLTPPLARVGVYPTLLLEENFCF